MELNSEQVKKALDWLDSLVGNSNDSDMALFTYQLLGILYDTCEELTEKNAIQVITAIELDKQVERLTEENKAWQMQLISEEEKADKAYYELACEVEDLRAENERLKARVIDENNLRRMAEEMLANGMSVVKADTVRKMQERLKSLLKTDYINGTREHALSVIDQIAKELLEDKK